MLSCLTHLRTRAKPVRVESDEPALAVSKCLTAKPFRRGKMTTSTRCSTLSKNTYVDKNKPHRVCSRFVVPRGMLSPSTVMSASSRSLPVPIIKQVTLLRLFPSLVTRSPARGGDARAPTFYPEPEPDLAALRKKPVIAGVFATSARFAARNVRRSAKISLLYPLTFTMP